MHIALTNIFPLALFKTLQVEVRANLKQPSGFLKRPIGSTTATQRVAGAPNTPDQ